VTAITLHNLADLLSDQGDFAGARPLFERALVIDEKMLGAEHQRTATDMSNLARVLRDTGHANEAEPLFHNAIAISEKALGRDHSQTQRTAHPYSTWSAELVGGQCQEVFFGGALENRLPERMRNLAKIVRLEKSDEFKRCLKENPDEHQMCRDVAEEKLNTKERSP
jgi:tetratricopeptide (TPR) repeat protein